MFLSSLPPKLCSEITPRANSFTGWTRRLEPINSTPTTAKSRQDSALSPYYQDHFQVVGATTTGDGQNNTESPYYFKVTADKPSGARSDLGTISEDDDAKTVDDDKEKQLPKSTTEESPYYFKSDPELIPSTISANDDDEVNCGYQELDLGKSENKVIIMEDKSAIKYVSDVQSNNLYTNQIDNNDHHRGNKASSYLRQISSKSDGSSCYSKLQDNNDYFFLLKPDQSPIQCSPDFNNDGDYFPLLKSNHSKTNVPKSAALREENDSHLVSTPGEVISHPKATIGNGGSVNHHPQIPNDTCKTQHEIASPDSQNQARENDDETKTSNVSEGSVQRASSDEAIDHDYFVLEKNKIEGD